MRTAKLVSMMKTHTRTRIEESLKSRYQGGIESQANRDKPDDPVNKVAEAKTTKNPQADTEYKLLDGDTVTINPTMPNTISQAR